MCGIGGILRVWPAGNTPPPPHKSIPEAWLDTIDERIKHRGPDGQGRFRDRATRPDGSTVDVALVHRRLAIIDPACGQQPMVSERGRPNLQGPAEGLVAVVFNGCIYNHRELRRELESKGHRFTTDHSDTEVLIHGWREWGVGVFQRSDGMFAAAIWDRSAGTLTLARDPFGEKPLYHTADRAGFFAFASTYTAVSAALSAAGIPNTTSSVAPWIKFGWNQLPPSTIIREFSQGTQLTALDSYPLDAFSPGYWGYIENAVTRDVSVDDADAVLRRAVHSRLEADAPLGVFLSGGIDSALVCAYAREAKPDLTAFTVRMPHPSFDESEAAATTARALNIRHQLLECAPKPAEDLVHAIIQLGLPFGDSSLLPSIWVSRAARQHVKVALSGDGGDELFLGYDRHRVLPAFTRMGRIPQAFRAAAAKRITPDDDPKSRRTRLSRLLNAATGGGYRELVAIYPPPFDAQLGVQWGVDGIHYGITPMNGKWSSDYGWARRFDLMFYLPYDLMRKSDTASMSVGLEVRAPILAREVAELGIHASFGSLMPGGQRKGLLRAIARKYLPPEIVDRPKQGFAIPIGDWFRTDYGQMKQLLLDHLNAADPWPNIGLELNRTFVAQMINEHMNHKRDHSQRLYMLLVLSIWSRSLKSA
ncbi:MAG TPA: asparagine synthase (glutamine-hydrolyzing) [Phycisphaerales bacterium]|nr:asparagine synthase (glutamine-hydrolyzing) [Phycisphaerales bacterium]